MRETAFFEAFPSLGSHNCRSEIQSQNLNRRGFLLKCRINLHEMPSQPQRNDISTSTQRHLNLNATAFLSQRFIG